MERNHKMQCIQKIDDCGTTSIFITLTLLKLLDILHSAANIATLLMKVGVMHPAKGSRQTQITVQYFDYLALVDKADLLVMPIHAYDSEHVLPWFNIQYQNMNWV